MNASEKVAILSVFINLAIFGAKGLSAFFTDSIALKAEAYHTLADMVAAITVLIGIKLAKRKAKNFPYGLYKIENMMAVGVSVIILYSGYEIILEAINNNQVSLKNTWLAVASLLFSIGLTFWFSRYEMRAGKNINSPILMADAEHVRTDVLSNVVVLVAVISSSIGYQLDKIAAMIIVGFIAKAGVQILIDGVKVLLDASLEYETLSKVEKIITDMPEVVSIKSLTGRNSGQFKFIEAVIIIKTSDFNKAHFVADRIERMVKEQINNIDQILIHYEPLQKDQITYALPLNEDQMTLNDHFGETRFFMLVTFNKDNKTAKHIEILTNPFSKVEKSKGISTAELLVGKMVDCVIVKSGFHSKGPYYVFEDLNVEIILTEQQTPADALSEKGLMLYPKS